MAQISRHLIRAIMLLGISTSVKTQENSFLLIFHLNNLTQTVWLLCPLTHQVQTSNNLCGKLLERLTDEENWRGRGEYDSSLLQTILPTRRMIVWDLETTFLPWEWKEPWYCSDKTKKKKKNQGSLASWFGPYFCFLIVIITLFVKWYLITHIFQGVS